MAAKRPSVIAIIPARGGSQRVPGKNLLKLAGMPLVAHSITHAKRATTVQEVYVSTEDPEIAAVAEEFGATVIRRPLELTGPQSSSEATLLHVLDERKKKGKKDPDLVVFLQCTSPIRRSEDIDRAVQQLIDEKADSLFSATRNFALIWAQSKKGPEPMNYDKENRRMEQDRDVQFRENGSIYVTKTPLLRKNKNRLGGKIAVYEMEEFHSFQVDTKEQVDLVRWIVRHQPVDFPKRIDLIAFDFDGVLTDNHVLSGGDGSETVRCSRSDSLGIAALHKAGVPMMVISTEEHHVVAARCRKLKLPCHQGLADKESFLKAYLKKEKIDPKHVAYLGNDVNDRGCLELVGFPVVVADAHPDVLSIARVVLSNPGGRGAVREFCDKLLAARGQ